ncbi:lipopolysaccharide biosynthesis protein [Tenacibaculum jejuense]|uniref:WagB n=1 Tax=Tenacibaculum jejuense TaxID=584609 RepID=A0A238U8U5_9FLAO|nr:lipopolysaccharide biosynthesis protein [Tenacibaculum jejuense]SNR14904.1 WagB [Tenacibaculum jejuense]
MFNNKKILFFSVKLFSIENKIENKLSSLGAIVDYYDERPSNSILVKGLIRLKRDLYKRRIDNYYRKILYEIKDKEYDFLFLIKGEVIPEFFLKKFCESNPSAKRIFYTWDSFNNNNNSKKILKYFQSKITFDSYDAKQFGLDLQPLFFFDSFKGIKKINNFKHHLLFIGTAHSDRYILANKIVDWCNDKELSSYTFFYLQGRIVYFFKRIFDSTFKYFDYKKLSFKSLTEQDIIDLYKDSNVILDINHPSQKGLTMRTLEAVGARKKIITTNPEIKKYIFYNENNILVIDRNNIVLNEDFFTGPYQDIPEQIYDALSIEGWLKSIFFKNQIEKWIVE